MKPPLWIDAPSAAQTISTSQVPEYVRTAAMELVTKGFTIMRGAQDQKLCEEAIRDYERFTHERADYVAQNKDPLGRELRLVNFHHYSEAALAIGTNSRVMAVLDYVFGSEACVYTSLTFKYGTQQPVHRDVPHFATWPLNYFFGVWTALEDIAPEAGPLFYYEGGHHFAVDHAKIWRETQSTHPDLNESDLLMRALDAYNGQVISESPNHGRRVTADMNRGDVAIWHPQTPHGGSAATDPMRTRWSTVFHCAPKEVQVYQHDSFFKFAETQPTTPRYGYRMANDRCIAVAGEVGYM